MARHFLGLYLLIVLTLAAVSWGQDKLLQIYSSQDAVEDRSLVIAIVAIALVMRIWIWPLSRDPRALEKAAAQFGNKNWRFDADIKSRSQIYPLAKTFRRMAGRIDGLITIAAGRRPRLRRVAGNGGRTAYIDLVGARTNIRVVQFLQSSVQVLCEESVHQESLGEIPGTNQVKRMFVVSILHHARIADHLPDPNSD